MSAPAPIKSTTDVSNKPAISSSAKTVQSPKGIGSTPDSLKQAEPAPLDFAWIDRILRSPMRSHVSDETRAQLDAVCKRLGIDVDDSTKTS